MKMANFYCSRKRQNGFTLIETIVVIVLVGAMMAGMTALFVNSIGNSHKPYLRQKALAAANAYMDEIMSKRWNENTPIGGGCVVTGSGSCTTLGAPAAAGISNDGEARATYDDVDDFNGTNDSPPQDSTGTAMPGYTGFTVAVTVSQPGAAWNGVAVADARLILVSVTSPTNENISVSAYRVNY